MKITGLKCAVIGKNPIVRVVTDEGIDGYAEVEPSKDYLKPHILHSSIRNGERVCVQYRMLQ